MDKERQIEEMAIIVGNCLYEHCEDCKYYDGNCCTNRSMGESEALYDSGYRKTLTSNFASDIQKAYKEGYEKGCETCSQSWENGYNDGYDDGKEDVENKAVKKFTEKLKARIHESDIQESDILIIEPIIEELLKEILK